ncbi:isochorismatase family protein [Paenibacillus spongiae]|uniref:Isochorismatase family protein n=1 Tax=Paenibacillus spongiae TaxID=2909671 RepID=A0ABY5SKN1_9BACL|nr:isochorismatase family protein [Paenibacillus spongiae]UVI33138.1 isochorismatase family protein [Paenibacillus spongiae]
MYLLFILSYLIHNKRRKINKATNKTIGGILQCLNLINFLTVLMAGISTDVCLTFPAIAATADGYDVYGVLDASGTWNALIEQAAMLRMSQAGVKLTTWVSLSAELQRDWSLPTGQALAQTYAEHFPEYSVLMDLHNYKIKI